MEQPEITSSMEGEAKVSGAPPPSGSGSSLISHTQNHIGDWAGVQAEQGGRGARQRMGGAASLPMGAHRAPLQLGRPSP